MYQRAEELGPFDLVIIDEAHMIPTEGEGMYRTFLRAAAVVNPKVRFIGLTATPFRMKSGMICEPDNILNHVCFEIGVRELIVKGFICPLTTKAGIMSPASSRMKFGISQNATIPASLLMRTPYQNSPRGFPR